VSSPLRTARALRAGGAMPRPGHSRPRDQWRADVSRAPITIGSQVVQLYGEPAAETPLYTFEDWARNIFGACGWSGNSIVFTAIDKRAAVFSEAVFKFRNKKTKRLYGDDRLNLLETPWPGGTTSTMLTRMEQDASLAGNAYIRNCGDRLERLRPDWVTLVSRLDIDSIGEQVRTLLGVVYDPQGADPERTPAFYPISEIAHYAPIPDPLGNFRGQSWISAVLRELRADLRMSEYRQAFFQNAATPNLVIKYEQKIAPERLARLRLAIEARHGGSENAFGTLVLDEGADIQPVGTNMVDSALDDLEAAVETRMLMASGVPALVAGARQGMQASAIGEYAQAMRAFADLKIRPNWRAACAALEKFTLADRDSQLWFDTTDVSALQQGEADRAATSTQQAGTINTLIMAGFTPDSATMAVTAADMTLLVHTGMMSVQMQPPGAAQQDGAAEPTGADTARSIAEIAQKIYLAVPNVLSADEARRILAQAGAQLDAQLPGKINGTTPALAAAN
jgi:HK97 family phage portal protein